MGAMTVQDMRDYARLALDSDSDEFPDALLDVWMARAQNRIQRVFEPWSFYESTWSWTSDGSQSITYETLGSDVDVIQSVKAPRWLLQFLPHELAVAKYAWSTETGGLTVEYSTFDDQLFFWPQPSAGDIYVVNGYRKPTVPIAPTDTVDLPDEFHPIIAEYMLIRCLEKQGDFFIAPTKEQEVEQELEMIRRRYLRGDNAGVQVVGGGKMIYPFFAERLAYPFE